MEYSTYMNGLFHAPKEAFNGDCRFCGGLGLKATWCCSGFECGCRGLPVDFADCECGSKQPTDSEIERWAINKDDNS